MNSNTNTPAPALEAVVDALREIAPESLAEPWDAVGLQLGFTDQPIRSAMLCIDLTQAVLDEAIDAQVDLILAYHPPIFKPLEALTGQSLKQRIILRAARAGLAIYSPHTALDAAAGGVNDWFAQGLGKGEIIPITPHPAATQPITDAQTPPQASSAASTSSASPIPGQGRLLTLHEPTELKTIISRVKQRLAMDHLQVGTGDHAQPVRRIGLCVGSGSSVLEQAPGLELMITGEMSHHHQLAALASGTSIILAGHSQTERPYLAVYRERLAAAQPTIDWRLSAHDHPPTTLTH